jgi:hypothetical protein
LLAAIPLATVALSLAVLVAAFGASALAGARIHESEPRSLLATVFFRGHLLRELPHLAALACCFAGALAPRGPRAVARAAAATLLVGAFLFAWASVDEGTAAAWLDLSQGRGARDLVAPGVHAAMHAAADVVLAPLYLAAAGLFAGAAPGPLAGLGALAAAALAAAGGLDAAVTPRALGHAAREVLAAATLTLPALAAATALLRQLAPPAEIARRRWALAAFAAAALAAAALAAVVLAGDPRAASADPSRPLLVSAAAHGFEHLLDPVVAVAIVWAVLTANVPPERAS